MREIAKNARTQYLESLLPVEPEAYQLAREYAQEFGLGTISLSPHEGRILEFLVGLRKPHRILEIGTLTGLSALYLESNLPAGGKIWTLEKNQKHAECAEKVFRAAGIGSERVEVVLGDARATLKNLESFAPFDFIFIDGNKAAYGDYLEWALNNTQSGSWIVADNVFLAGAVWGQETTQKFNAKQIQTLREFNLKLSNRNLFESLCLPTDEGLFVALRK